jgi:hypothetical protein
MVGCFMGIVVEVLRDDTGDGVEETIEGGEEDGDETVTCFADVVTTSDCGTAEVFGEDAGIGMLGVVNVVRTLEAAAVGRKREADDCEVAVTDAEGVEDVTLKLVVVEGI